MTLQVTPSLLESIVAWSLVGLVIYAKALSGLKRHIFKASLDGQFDRALRLDRMARMLPGFGEPLEGVILFAAGRYPEAQAFLRPLAFDEAGTPRLQSTSFYIYSLALVNDGREAEAQPLLEAAIRVPQKTGSLHVALATCLLSTEKEPERAKELLEHAMNSWPAPTQIYDQRADAVRRTARYAWALAACGQRSEAEAKIDEANARSAGFKNYDLAGVKYFIGETWRVLGEKTKARAAFDEAVALNPEGSVATSVARAMTKLRRS